MARDLEHGVDDPGVADTAGNDLFLHHPFSGNI
jgi:hypothetical protein